MCNADIKVLGPEPFPIMLRNDEGSRSASRFASFTKSRPSKAARRRPLTCDTRSETQAGFTSSIPVASIGSTKNLANSLGSESVSREAKSRARSAEAPSSLRIHTSPYLSDTNHQGLKESIIVCYGKVIHAHFILCWLFGSC